MSLILTRNQLRTISEAKLREVLLELFRAMGFREPTEYHGATESGKDIVMWQPDGLRTRLDYAVVVKAKKISAGGAAREVLGQLDECFGSPYTDPSTLESRHVDRAVIVTSKEITKPARDSISNQLKARGWRGQVDVIDGALLYDRIREYLPRALVWDALEAAKTQLDQAGGEDGAFKYAVQIDPEGHSSVFVFPGESSKDHPIRGSLTVDFPETAEGQLQRTKWLDRHETGRSFRVKKEFIKSFQLPEFLEAIAGQGKLEFVHIDAVELSQPIRLRQEFFRQGDHFYSSSEIIFTHQFGGIKESSFDNRGQCGPVVVTWTYKKEEDLHRFNVNLHEKCRNAYQIHQWMLYESAMAKADRIVCVDHLTGTPIAEITPDPVEVDPDQAKAIELFSRLSDIQTNTGVVITVDAKGIRSGEMPLILEASEAVRNGVVRYDSGRVDFEPHPGVDLSKKLGETVTVGPILDSSNARLSILGKESVLGPRFVAVRGALQESCDPDTGKHTSFFIDADPENPILVYYPKWVHANAGQVGVARDE